MLFKGIISFIIVIALLKCNLAFKLENGKAYFIDSGLDKLHLVAVNNANNCKKRADVITVDKIPPAPDARKWTYHTNKKEKWDFLVGAYGNEITLENKPPYCSYRPQAYKLTKISGAKFMIQNLDTKKCLTETGLGKRISWEDCQPAAKKYAKQFWKFTPLPK